MVQNRQTSHLPHYRGRRDFLINFSRETMELKKRYKFIGCEVFHREACHLASGAKNLVDVEFLSKGLHDLETPDMVNRIQSAVDAASSGDVKYDAILLGYGRCNDGLVGVLAHEVAHAIINQYFAVPPPSKVQEILSQYVDKHLWGDYY